MKIPPNMKRRVVAPLDFAFTELSLSDDEMSQLCVIPSRAAAVPVPLPVMRRHRRKNAAGMAAAASMAFLALPSCTSLTPPAFVEATVEVVQLARAAAFEKTVMVGAADVEVSVRVAPAHAHDVRSTSHSTAVPPLVDAALLVRAEHAMNAGQYRAALAMYQKLLRRQPSQVDALFGAALASHELMQTRGSAAYLQRTLVLQPDHPLANVLAGFGDQLGHRYGDARARYSRFLSVEESGDQAEEIRAVLQSMPKAGPASVTGSR